MQGIKLKILFVFVYCLYLLIILPSAFAHRVNVFAYVEGNTVYTESFFPDGKKVKNGIIEVYDTQGRKLLEGITDDKGQFNFKIPKKEDLKIVINASMGHRNSYILSQDELLISEAGKVQKLPKESVPYTKIIGGIGCIFGIAGITFYFLSKKQKNN